MSENKQEERHSYFCKCLLSEIDALEVKEQPSLPDNLDKAANNYASKTECAVVACRGFKAGAEWAFQYK